jgi:hypothetical protein
VFAAFFVGTVEILGLIEQQYRLGGGFWTFMGNFDINKAGFVVVGVFVLTWAVALAIWHFGKIEQKMGHRQGGSAGLTRPATGRDQRANRPSVTATSISEELRRFWTTTRPVTRQGDIQRTDKAG